MEDAEKSEADLHHANSNQAPMDKNAKKLNVKEKFCNF